MLTVSRQLNKLAVFVCVAAALAGGAIAQKPVAGPKTPKAAGEPPRREPPMAPEKPIRPPDWDEGRRGAEEKALAVASNVNIKLPCVSDAKITVTGWNRDEIRVFVKNGSKIAFKVHEKDPKSGKPVWVLITKRMTETPGPQFSECLSGERIDIEVPVGAAMSVVGKETETRIDSVNKVDLANAGGNVSLRNIPGGINAKTYEGDVAVENSAGQISLETTTGNIIAYGVKQGQVGDVFKAKTSNGQITLQNVEHRQIVADSINGEVLFSGKFLPGGLYTLKTTAGSIRMAIPHDTSCRMTAIYGGTMKSAVPYKTITENVSPAGNTLKAQFGTGDATVNLVTPTGRILITQL